ncbi:hypothetical protein B0T21DRAFT_351444 [Apiosordaria backusii]|uniref:Uncharacterized protein n=1 Tax=Apiosordaria backusii TaxID=314023 RepID=A0AA40AT81_9PEZI|nr:hypothetical protein B0T21DRAFT_351444 [Apiosordaria backusii]
MADSPKTPKASQFTLSASTDNEAEDDNDCWVNKLKSKKTKEPGKPAINGRKTFPETKIKISPDTKAKQDSKALDSSSSESGSDSETDSVDSVWKSGREFSRLSRLPTGTEL